MNLSSSRQVRDWAWARGLNVSSTGGIPRALGEAYNRANPDKPYPLPRQHDYALTPERRERVNQNRNKQRSMT